MMQRRRDECEPHNKFLPFLGAKLGKDCWEAYLSWFLAHGMVETGRWVQSGEMQDNFNGTLTIKAIPTSSRRPERSKTSKSREGVRE